LREAQDELTRIINELEAASSIDEISFSIGLEHLYNHLNTAWNSRNASPSRLRESSTEDFYAWRSFPSDIDMGHT
jgi:hypothetical protein